MPTIYEAFGYRLNDQSPDAQTARANATCAFTKLPCDGGGNRWQSQIKLQNHPQLATLYPDRAQLMPGVCSVETTPNSPPWIVCPRRLLALIGTQQSPQQAETENRMLQYTGYPSGTRVGVWQEVHICYSEQLNGITKSFDYNFDYVLHPVGSCRVSDIAAVTQIPDRQLRRDLTKFQYTFANRNGEDYIEDFAVLPNVNHMHHPSVIEVMTSSTSGGDKNKRTTVPMAFEDAVLGQPHQAPSINKRQVWARMVSQLIVKTEVGVSWGGRTLWLVQDRLAEYITESTGLNLGNFVAGQPHQVNILSFAYPNQANIPAVGPIPLRFENLYAGPMSTANAVAPDFDDIIRAPLLPAIWRLMAALTKSRHGRRLIVP